MLDPEYLDSCSDQLLALIDELSISLIGDIARRIAKTKHITDTAKHQAHVLQNAGMVYQDAIKRIGQTTGYIDREIDRLFKEAGVKNIKNESVIYKMAGMEPKELHQSKEMQQILNANLRKTKGEIKNLTLTTANKAQSAYINACNSAMLKVQTGAFSYDKAIADAIKEAAGQGTEVLFPSGHVDKLDVAVRRAVLTGVNQSAAEMTLAYAQEMGCDYVEVTAHSGARPSHALWQGLVFCISGKDPNYPPFSMTGYGTGEGLCGWNCRHNFHVFIPGVSVRAYTDKMLEGLDAKNYTYNGKTYKEYQISQMQRFQERQIRGTKRKLTGYDAGIKAADGDDVLKSTLQQRFESESVRLKEQEKKLKEFCRQTGRRVESVRTQVHAVLDSSENIVGFNRSVAQKAVWAAKLTRKEKNTGKFAGLEIPLQKRSVDKISKKYGLEIRDLTIKIQRNEELIKLHYLGSTDYDNIGRVDLFPRAFKDEKELVRTIIHERCHVLQLRKYGKKYTQDHLAEMEKQAYKFEEFWYNIVRKRVEP